MNKTKMKPPFGVGVKRFLCLGYHPKFETRSGTFRYPDISPALYENYRPRKIISKVPRWTRALEIEEYSRQMGYHCKHILKDRSHMQSIMGPAWHDVPSPDPGRACVLSKEKTLQNTFRQYKSLAVPGPGTYGKNHNPYLRTEEKSREKGYSHSLLASFDQYSHKSRSLVVELPYSLPPNLYNIKGSVDELISKCISKRGPYDLFSGERFPDLNPQKLSVLKSPIKSTDLNHRCNYFKGKFSKYGRDGLKTFRLAWNSLPPLDDSLPGPNYYNVSPPKKIRQALAPFNISKQSRSFFKCGLHPSPGRYDPDIKKHIRGDGMQSVFLSKTERKVFKRIKHSWFE